MADWNLAMTQSLSRTVFGRLIRTAVVAASVVCLAGPSSAALAAPSGPTMIVTARAFPGGSSLPNTFSGTFPLTAGAQVTLSAPPQLFGSGTPQAAYGFLFWNSSTDVLTTPAISFTAPSDTSTFHVTAWYVPEGGSGGGGSGVQTYAFSLNQDQVISNTPIASVTPSSAWSGPPSSTVSTTTSPSAVGITAKPLISGYGLFRKWLQFGNGSIANTVLSVPSGGSSFAIAFFGIPSPDPCEDARTQLEDLSPGDFLTLAAYQRARQQLTQQLLACERKYGEI